MFLFRFSCTAGSAWVNTALRTYRCFASVLVKNVVPYVFSIDLLLIDNWIQSGARIDPQPLTNFK